MTKIMKGVRSKKAIAQMRFQTETGKPHGDWLALSPSFSTWLRAPSSQNKCEDPPRWRLGAVTLGSLKVGQMKPPFSEAV